MLMKHTQVTREGEVREPPIQQLTYGALLQGRTAMVTDAANTAKKALTIAVRYAAVRRQFKSSPDAELETQILDYPIHQRRLMPLVAQAVAFGFTALQLQRLFEETSSALEALEPGDPNLNATIELLKETHATSAGLKAFCTWATLDTIEKARQACGGHGYSSYNGFASMFTDFAVHCSWEGDNSVLSLQSGRALIAAYRDAMDGKKLAEGTSYLNNIEQVLSRKCRSNEELVTLAGIEEGWATVAAHAVRKAGEDFAALLKQGKSRDEAFEACSQVRFVAASVHTSGFIFRQFKKAVEKIEKGADGVREHLEKVAVLYGLWQLEEKAAFFLRSGWLSGSQLDHAQAKVTALCYEIRLSAVPLVDSFAISDHILNSPIGRYDGDIYRAYFAQVRKSNPQGKEHPYFERIIKPFMHRPTQELEDFDEMGLDDEIQEIKEEQEEAAEEAKAAEEEKKQQLAEEAKKNAK
jgi:acyl-CoA oxidase